MIESPFHFEEWLTPAEFQTLGKLFLRWSHIEHIIGNCLRVILRLDPDEATAIVFPMPLERRLDKIKEITDLRPLSPEAEFAFQELNAAMRCINYVRNSAVHTILSNDIEQGTMFHLRSKKRSIRKEDVLSVEELTNYAANAVTHFRFALGFKEPAHTLWPLPDRPAIPEFLRSLYREPKLRNAAVPQSPRESSQA